MVRSEHLLAPIPAVQQIPGEGLESAANSSRSWSVTFGGLPLRSLRFSSHAICITLAPAASWISAHTPRDDSRVRGGPSRIRPTGGSSELPAFACCQSVVRARCRASQARLLSLARLADCALPHALPLPHNISRPKAAARYRRLPRYYRA